ncbi:MAG: DUF6941 family protein [Candidatus Limnocylindria bacterium]
MRIDYLLVADAHNRSEEGTENLLGADWRSLTVPRIPWERPMVIAFSATAIEETDLGSQTVRAEVEDSDDVAQVFEEKLDIERIQGPEGLPLGSISGQWSGRLIITAAGVHRVRLTVANAAAETIFVVHQQPSEAVPKAAHAKPASRRRQPRSSVARPGRSKSIGQQATLRARSGRKPK